MKKLPFDDNIIETRHQHRELILKTWVAKEKTPKIQFAVERCVTKSGIILVL